MPRGVEVPEEPPSLGADYDTDVGSVTRCPSGRGVIAEGPMRLVVRSLADPEIFGTRPAGRLRGADAADGDDEPPR